MMTTASLSLSLASHPPPWYSCLYNIFCPSPITPVSLGLSFSIISPYFIFLVQSEVTVFGGLPADCILFYPDLLLSSLHLTHICLLSA